MNMEQKIDNQRKIEGKSPTNNEQFDRDGFLFLENFTDVSHMIEMKPDIIGTYEYNYDGTLQKIDVDPQVTNSLSRYKIPKYRDLQIKIKPKIEKILGKKLYPTYNYDRFYSPGQELKCHIDRHSCEISVSLHISSNLNKPWPLFFKKQDNVNENRIIIKEGDIAHVNFLNSGDAVLYKGCERPHWRDPMPSKYGKMENKIRKFMRKGDDTYYHQVFIHYVLSDGIYSYLNHDYNFPCMRDYFSKRDF